MKNCWVTVRFRIIQILRTFHARHFKCLALFMRGNGMLAGKVTMIAVFDVTGSEGTLTNMTFDGIIKSSPFTRCA